MSLSVKKILGVYVTASSKNDILEEIKKYLQQSTINNQQLTIKKASPFLIFTPNPEIITYAQKNHDFKQIVNTAQINLPDGAGVVWAIKKLYAMEIRQIAGVDFMLGLVKLVTKESLTIGLIGGRGGVALATLECLQKKHPKLSGWAMEAPEIEIVNGKLKIENREEPKDKDTSDGGKLSLRSSDSSEVEGLERSYFLSLAKKIIERKTAILFVAMGFPKQEYFINRIAYHVSRIKYDKPLVLMAVGGSFDYISSRVPRAPKCIRDKGFEWLYRLIREPGRLPRQLKGAEFFWQVFNSQILTHRV